MGWEGLPGWPDGLGSSLQRWARGGGAGEIGGSGVAKTEKHVGQEANLTCTLPPSRGQGG